MRHRGRLAAALGLALFAPAAPAAAGTDRLNLFDKALADRVMAMSPAALKKFVASRPGLDAEPPFEGAIHADVAAWVAEQAATSEEEIALDYWACFAEVFSEGEPSGSISSRDYLPHQEEERFLLLNAEHLDQMLASLRAHADDVQIMSTADIRRLEKWRDRLRADPKLRAAYFFDY